MIENIKTGSIVALLIAVFLAYFYGKSQVPKPPDLAISSSVEAEKKSEEKKDLLTGTIAKLTSKKKNEKTGETQELTLEDLSFQQDQGKMVLSDSLSIKDSIQVSSLDPDIAYGGGCMHPVKSKLFENSICGLKAGPVLGKQTIVLGELSYDFRHQEPMGGFSVLFLK